ncbi:MAG: TolC family protein, partial [Verrucomicrobia bacterium]|nr:TolC family protein [Verrucomicrobiota bacterium]
MIRHTLSACAAAIVIGLAGCATRQPAVTPADAITLPKAFSLYPDGETGAGQWWTAFAVDELNALVDEALTNGLSVADARLRLEQAELRVQQAGAALIPSVDLQAGAGTTRARRDTGLNADRTVTTDSYSLGLAASYEIDLWGRVRAERRAILHEAAAGRHDLAAAEVSLAATVCQTWIDLVATRMTHALLTEQLEANRKILELVDMRFRRAMASAVDLYRQRQSVAAIEAALPTAAATERTLANALAVLLGRTPSAAP